MLPSLHLMPLLQIIFFLLSHFEIQELFAHLLYHSTLFFILTKAAFHLASSSCCNFVTRSLNCKYSKEANCIMKTWVFCWNTLFMHLIDNNMFSYPPRLKLNYFLTWKTKSFFCALYMLMKLLFRTTWIRLLISLNSTLLDLKSMCKCYS